MKSLFGSLLLLLATMSFAETCVMEVSVVADWEATSYYTSREELESVIRSTFDEASVIFTEQLNIELDVTHIEIPVTEAADVIANHTHSLFLLDSLNDYRRDNPIHRNADATVLFTKRNLVESSEGSKNLLGVAGIRTICTDLSTAVVELTDTGLDYLTLAHELGHILGAIHDGVSPCENENSTGYLMSSSIPQASPFLSQCSINVIESIIEDYGHCLFEVNTVPDEIIPDELDDGSSGGGSMNILFLILLIAVRYLTNRQYVV